MKGSFINLSFFSSRAKETFFLFTLSCTCCNKWCLLCSFFAWRKKILFPSSKTPSEKFSFFYTKEASHAREYVQKFLPPSGHAKKSDGKMVYGGKKEPLFAFEERRPPSLSLTCYISLLYFVHVHPWQASHSFLFFSSSSSGKALWSTRKYAGALLLLLLPSLPHSFDVREGGEKEEGEENGGASFPPFSSLESRSNIYFSKNIVDLFLFSKKWRTI